MYELIAELLIKLNFIIPVDTSRVFTEYNNSEAKQLKFMFMLFISWIGLFISILIMVKSLLKDIHTGKHYWFAPSGALLVFCAFSVEFLSSVTPTYDENLDYRFINISTLYEHIYTYFRYFSYFIAFLGTIIWGYGHMFFKRKKSAE